jgi:EF hand
VEQHREKAFGSAGLQGLNAFLFNLKVICMRTRTIAKPPSKHLVANFELCSVILLAAFAMSAASASHAQSATASSTGSSSSTRSQMAPIAAADAVPANKVTRMDLDAAFNRADVDRDGKLSRTESEHFPAVAQRFEQIDSNHDSFISREEFNHAASN